MGPFQEYEEKKSPEKGSPRSRIPRLVLHTFRPKEKESPLSDSPASEEEGKDCEMSDHSKRTVSTTSYCSDDTGCPTSQSVSPSKTPSGSENSPHSPLPPERKTKVKRVRMMTEWNNVERTTPRHKREQRSAMKKSTAKGSEADFSSSSSSGSLKTSVLSMSTGKKNPSRSRVGAHTRPVPVFKPPGSPKLNRDAALYAPYRTPPRTPPSTNSSSNNSSPNSRRVSRYHSCGDNHGIRPPNPEQYLTPLQQKEVAIRHLKIKLMESENRVRDREADIEELKSQLDRMREDWIEEECHRVEAQLSLKEARKEIKQLRQVVETMKSSLMEKDKGIQKYFVDINIQNRKLESLLQSMELSQSGSNLHDEPAEEFNCDSSSQAAVVAASRDGADERKGKMTGGGEEEGGMGLGDQAAEEMADSGLLVNDEMANRADILEQVFMSTAVDFGQDSGSGSNLRQLPGPGVSALLEEGGVVEKCNNDTAHLPLPLDPICSTFTACPSPPPPSFVDQSVQADAADTVTISPLDLQALLLQLLKLNGGTTGGAAAPDGVPAAANLPDLQTLAPIPESTPVHLDDSTPALSVHTPCPAAAAAAPKSPDTSTDSGLCCSESSRGGFMEELDFTVDEKQQQPQSLIKASRPHAQPDLGVVCTKRHWSNSFLVDLVAVAAPVLPTVAWLYSRHGVDGSAPVYNIAALIRGCCVVGLHSLRHVTRRPDV